MNQEIRRHHQQILHAKQLRRIKRREGLSPRTCRAMTWARLGVTIAAPRYDKALVARCAKILGLRSK